MYTVRQNTIKRYCQSLGCYTCCFSCYLLLLLLLPLPTRYILHNCALHSYYCYLRHYRITAPAMYCYYYCTGTTATTAILTAVQRTKAVAVEANARALAAASTCVGIKNMTTNSSAYQNNAFSARTCPVVTQANPERSVDSISSGLQHRRPNVVLLKTLHACVCRITWTEMYTRGYAEAYKPFRNVHPPRGLFSTCRKLRGTILYMLPPPSPFINDAIGHQTDMCHGIKVVGKF